MPIKADSCFRVWDTEGNRPLIAEMRGQVWPRYNHVKGWLDDLESYTTIDGGQDQGPATTMNIGTDHPPEGSGLWYLLRQTGPL